MTTPSSEGSRHYPAHSNPNITRLSHCGSSNGILARSSSHPPEIFCWEDPIVTRGPPPPCLTSVIDETTQTEADELLYHFVTQNPRKVLSMLGLDPDKITSTFYKTNIKKSHTFPGNSNGKCIFIDSSGDMYKADNRNKDVTVNTLESEQESTQKMCPFFWDPPNVYSNEENDVCEAINNFPQTNSLKFRKYNTIDSS